MKVRPLLAAPFAAAAGIALAATHATDPSILLVVVVLGIGAMALRWASVRLSLVLLAIAALGAGRFAVHQRSRVLPDGDVRAYIGRVASPPAGAPEAWRFLVATDRERILVRLRSGAPPAWGQTVRFTAATEPPARPTNPGEFDYPAYLERQGVFAIASVRRIEALPDPVPLSLRLAAWLRARVERVCRARLGDDAPVAAGILLSLTGEIESDLRDDFAVTGTVHILSTSGMHLAVIASALQSVLRRRRPAVRAVVTLSCVWLVALSAGFGPAVLRSAIALSVALAAPLLRRDAEPVHAVALAALSLLIADPYVLWDPGAQLSFATVTALLVGMPTLERLADGPDGGWWECVVRPRLVAALGASGIAYLASTPLTAYHFHVVSLVAPVANLPVAALSEVALLLGALGVAADGLGGLCAPVWWTSGGAVSLLTRTTAAFADPPNSALSCVSPPSSCVVVALAALVIGLRRAHVHVVRTRLFRR